jgi:enoyl-CoA hydratase/carnithine racemase
MSHQFIVVRRSPAVTTITLNRPEVMNAIHSPMHAELAEALDAFAADPKQRVCVLTGAGERAFCAGSDLKYAASSDLGVGEGKRAYPRSGYGGIAERFDLSKPVIAAVNGVALGGGFEIVLACDIVIASDTALFGLPEPLVGAIALGGGLHRLPRQIGLKHALGIILTGRKVAAAEGKTLGFVNEVVPQTELNATAARWAADILRCSPVAIQASKEVVYRGLGEPSLADAMRHQSDYAGFRAWLESEDLREGPRAFAQKRAPSWAAPPSEDESGGIGSGDHPSKP